MASASQNQPAAHGISGLCLSLLSQTRNIAGTFDSLDGSKLARTRPDVFFSQKWKRRSSCSFWKRQIAKRMARTLVSSSLYQNLLRKHNNDDEWSCFSLSEKGQARLQWRGACSRSPALEIGNSIRCAKTMIFSHRPKTTVFGRMFGTINMTRGIYVVFLSPEEVFKNKPRTRVQNARRSVDDCSLRGQRRIRRRNLSRLFSLLLYSISISIFFLFH